MQARKVRVEHRADPGSNKANHALGSRVRLDSNQNGKELILWSNSWGSLRKLTKELIGEDVFNDIVDKKLKELVNAKLTPISDIKSSSDYGDRNLYVYTFAPTNWLKLEHAIGEENMWIWINKLLTVESEFTNYDFLIKTLGDVLNDKALLEVVESHYFLSIPPLDSKH